MALTAEQEQQILDFVSKGAAAATAAEAAAAADAAEKAKLAAKPANGDDAGGKSVAQKAKEDLEAEQNAKTATAQLSQSIKFNMIAKDFVEKNKSLLPPEVEKILVAVEGKNFNDEIEKANELRKGLLDSFLSQDENLKVLTPSLQERAGEYKKLAEIDKAKRSGEFWDLAETGIALKAGAQKAETLNKINGVNSGDPSNPLEGKIMAVANKKFNINNEQK